MRKKLIFLDVDGTLCPRGSSAPPPSAMAAIRRAQELGHRVFLSTGRSKAALRELMELGFDGAITAAGGHVELAGEVLYDRPMPDSRRCALQELLMDRALLWVLECGEGNFGPTGICPEGISLSLWNWWAKACRMLSVRDITEYNGAPVYKIVLAAERREDTDFLRASAEDFRFVFQPAGDVTLCELISRAFHKGQGVEQICAALNTPLADTVCIGDSLNDREMMEVAGVSVAMADGDPELKKLCHRTCPPAHQDGLAIAFGELGLL